ncbi:hypothetical protein ACFU5X_14205, partial [Streptomyces platensis]
MSEAMVSAVDETAFADLVSKIQDAEAGGGGVRSAAGGTHPPRARPAGAGAGAPPRGARRARVTPRRRS